MNISNNKRRKSSQEKIEKTFVELLQSVDISEITVTKICKLTSINRTTFYNNYLDIYDLADKIRLNLEQDVFDLYNDERLNNYNSNDFSKIFRLVKDNQLFFKTYFKLEQNANLFTITKPHQYDTNLAKDFYDNEYIDYHIAFFKAGFNAIIKKWLDNGCEESVEEMCKILSQEYFGKSKF